jgi:phage/plasmid primase-like uncharacterized protein
MKFFKNNFQHKLSTQDVKQAASGNWLKILEEIAPSLKSAIAKCGDHVPCPVYGGKDGFRLFNDAPLTGGSFSNKDGGMSDGFATLMFVTGLPFPTVKTLVAKELGLSNKKVVYIKPKACKAIEPVSTEYSVEEIRKRQSKLNGFWKQSNRIHAGDRVNQYLSSRGIKRDWLHHFPSVRFHPNAWFKNAKGEQDSAPAVALMFSSKDGVPCNIHKTFLDKNGVGKANLEKSKIQMRPTQRMTGGAVRIGDTDSIVRNNGVLHVSEGFENACSVIDHFNQPCWATLSASLLQGFVPPKEVKKLIVWADNDAVGKGTENVGFLAAKKLQDRLLKERPDLITVIKLPPNPKEDWNDLYSAGKLEHFCLVFKD